jgi:hypothetical protein
MRLVNWFWGQVLYFNIPRQANAKTRRKPDASDMLKYKT